jgi:excisionase family DNA binding protein
MEKLLTIPEVAALLNVGRTTVYRLVESGELRSKVVGKNKLRKTIRIKKEWVDDYVNSDIPEIKISKKRNPKNTVEIF